jgi:hypothetical protein
MPVQYIIKLYDDAGVALGIVTPLDIAVVHKVNTPSVATFSVNRDAPVVEDLDYGYIIEIIRSDPAIGMQAYTEFVGFIRFWNRSFGQNPILSVTAVDAKSIMQARIVAWYPNLLGTSFFKTSTYATASSIMVELWNRNVGSQANGNPPYFGPNLTRRYGTGLQRWSDGRVTTATDATNLGIGTAIEVSCSGENVLNTMVKVADTGGLDFDVRFTISTLNYSLFYADNLGADRRSYVKFSQQNNTVGNLNQTTNVMNYASLFHAVGKGSDKNNLRSRYPTTAPTGVDLREAYIKGADQTTTTQLFDLAYSRFRRQRFSIEAFDIEVLQSGTWRYGRDYFLGDLVYVDVQQVAPLTRKVYAVSLSINAEGFEEVRIDLAEV